MGSGATARARPSCTAFGSNCDFDGREHVDLEVGWVQLVTSNTSVTSLHSPSSPIPSIGCHSKHRINSIIGHLEWTPSGVGSRVSALPHNGSSLCATWGLRLLPLKGDVPPSDSLDLTAPIVLGRAQFGFGPPGHPGFTQASLAPDPLTVFQDAQCHGHGVHGDGPTFLVSLSTVTDLADSRSRATALALASRRASRWRHPLAPNLADSVHDVHVVAPCW